MFDCELLKQARGEKKADLVLKNGLVVDVFNEELIKTDVAIAAGKIIGTGLYEGKEEIDANGQIISPGFIDGHLHLESTMVRVEEFASLVIPQGTTTIMADPHEIANVAGIEGIRYLLKAGQNLPWNFNLMLPSCVPATIFETSGAKLKAEDLAELLGEEGIFGLGEVMDFTGIIAGEKNIWDKITLVGNRFKDGHAPGLQGKELNTYLLAGIKADHECTTPAEALEKVRKGMYVMIREGSVTRDLVNLLPVVTDKNSHRFLFATDDRHPEDLIKEGHINFMIKKAIKNGMSPLKAIRLATINAAQALGIDKIGAVAPSYQADLVIIDNLTDLNIKKVFKDGQIVAENGKPLFKVLPPSEERGVKIYNSVKVGPITSSSFKLPPGKRYRVMELIKNQVITKKGMVSFSTGLVTEDDLIKEGLVKLAVVERHHRTSNVGLGLLKGFGLKTGAIATSIVHDSHNIIVAGLDEKEMLLAIKGIEELQGGIVIVKGGKVIKSLALPIAGLISEKSLQEVAKNLQELKEMAISLGVNRKNPFMTLAFMALPVIPELKLTDKGLFDLERFQLVSLVVD